MNWKHLYLLLIEYINIIGVLRRKSRRIPKQEKGQRNRRNELAGFFGNRRIPNG